MTPQERYDAALAAGAIPLEAYEAGGASAGILPAGAIPLEEYDASRAQQRPGFIETTRDVISGRPARSALPINILAEIVGNLPTEIGAAAGISRGMAAGPAVRGAITGATRGAPGGPIAAAAYGSAGALTGALAEASLQRGLQTGSPTMFGNPFDLPNIAPQATTDALSAVAGGMGAPLVLGVLGNLGRRIWPWGERSVAARLLAAQGLRDTPSQMTASQRAAMGERLARADEFGVPYTYGELSGDRALMAREAIMRALPGSADPMTDFLRNRARTIQESATRVATDIAPVTPYEGFARAGQAARDSIENMVKRRRDATRGLYADIWRQKHHMNAESFISSIRQASINEEAGLQRIYRAVIEDIQSATTPDGTVPVQKLHNIQSRYNARAKNTQNDARQQRVYSDIGQGIKSALDRAVPGYAHVSDVYRTMSKPIERAREATRIGKAANANRVDVANRVKNWFTEGAYPEEIRDIRNIFRDNLEPLQYSEAMKGLQAAFLRNVVDRIRPNQSGESILNIGGKIAQALGGDPTAAGGVRISQMMDELYTPAQQEKLGRMLRMLDETSQILSIKSPTQPRQIAEEMQRTASQDVLQELGQAGAEAAATGGLNVIDWVLRSPGRLWRTVTRERAQEMEANTRYAHALNEGTTATVRHFDQLERAVRGARELPPEDAVRQLQRAWGTLFGTSAASE